MSGEARNSSAGVAWGRMVLALAVTALLAGVLFWTAGEGFYVWAKAIHIIAVISWMAGMLYLPRLFVYHVDAERGSAQSETFKIMERRLLRGIINPAMVVSWVFGLWLAWRGFQFSGEWLHVKIGLVVILSGVHGYFSVAVRAFGEDRNTRSAKYWRFINEVPTLLMVGIVILVAVKPF